MAHDVHSRISLQDSFFKVATERGAAATWSNTQLRDDEQSSPVYAYQRQTAIALLDPLSSMVGSRRYRSGFCTDF
jgi:hypothetical protein